MRVCVGSHADQIETSTTPLGNLGGGVLLKPRENGVQMRYAIIAFVSQKNNARAKEQSSSAPVFTFLSHH